MYDNVAWITYCMLTYCDYEGLAKNLNSQLARALCHVRVVGQIYHDVVRFLDDVVTGFVT